MSQVYIFLKIINAQQCVFTRFVRLYDMKLFCKNANQNKNNFRFTTLTKHMNNQTNCCITLEKIKKIWICLVFIQLYLDSISKVDLTIIQKPLISQPSPISVLNLFRSCFFYLYILPAVSHIFNFTEVPSSFELVLKDIKENPYQV